MIRTLVVGCGSIGSRHISNLDGLPDVEVIAHDIDSKRAEQIHEEYGVPTTTDLDEELHGDIDAVFVCTPPSSHLEIATKALESGAHVFLEKPLSHTLEGTQEFVDKAERSEQVVFVACNMRYHPPVRQMQEWLDDGDIGDIQFLRLRYGNDLRNWRSNDYRESYSADSEAGGGITLDGVHELDIALKWLGGIDSLCSTVGELSDLEIDVEDTVEILLEGDATMAEVHLDYIRPERARTYEVIGSEGMIRWMGKGKNPERSTVELQKRHTDEKVSKEIESTLNEQYVAEVKDFIDCIKTGTAPEMDARRGREVLKLAYAAIESGTERTFKSYP